MAEIVLAQAVNSALREEMLRDERVYILGESVRGGAFGVTTGLVQELGPERVMDTPISETAIAGSCVGAALAGYRPVADMMIMDFFSPAHTEVCKMAAWWGYTQNRNGGMILPIVYMAVMGGYTMWGPEHTGADLAFFKHTPGLKIVVPTTAYDAKGLLKTAIRDDNPVIYLVHALLLGAQGEVPEEDYTVPFGKAVVRREGRDVTVVATGYMVSLAIQAAEQLAAGGVGLEVIDPRTIEPFDLETVLDSVKKTGRVVLVDEDKKVCSVTAEIGMQIVEEAFYYLKAPVRRVGAEHVPLGTRTLEQAALPSVEKIVAAVEAVLKD